MIFVDTSALIAIIVQEPEATEFANRVEASEEVHTSVHVMLEATMRLSTMLNVEPMESAETIVRWIERAKVNVMPIDAIAFGHAVDAFTRFGKGRHPARLNFANCLSYACAKAAGATLLYKGNDFARTDMG